MRNKDGAPDIERLKRFSSRLLTKDRGESLFFSGRSQEIENIELTIEGVMERLRLGKPKPASDETWLFQGPPGVGKSALLEKLEDRWKAKETEGTPIAVPLRPDIILNQANLVAKIADAVAAANDDSETADKLHQIVSVDRVGSTDIGSEIVY